MTRVVLCGVQREIVDINLVAFLFLSRVFFALFFLLFFLLRLFEIFTFSRSSVSCASSHKKENLSKENAIKLLRTRARIRKHAHPKPNPRETTFARSHDQALLAKQGWFLKKNRERTPQRIHSFIFYGGDRSNSYILTMVRCLRA